MKKKTKIKDTTKFIIALSICLGIICTSIVFASVFSRQNDSAKAETITDSEYSFAVYDNPYDGVNLSYLVNNVDSDFWNMIFVYFTRNGQPYEFNTNNIYTFEVDYVIYNPNGANVYDFALSTSSVAYYSRIDLKPINRTDVLIRDSLFFSPSPDNTIGGVCFTISDIQAEFYIMYLNVRINGIEFTFGDSNIYNLLISQYNSAYNQGFTDGVDSIASTIVPPLPNHTLQGANFTSSCFSLDVSSADIEVSSATNGYFQNVSFGFAFNASPNTFYGDTEYQIDFSVSVPDLSPLANSLTSCALYGLTNVYTIFDNITFSSSGSSNYTYYSGFRFVVSQPQVLLGIRFNFENLDLPIARNYLMSITNISITAIDSSVNAYEAGYDAGFTNGQTSGYNEGYTDGLATNDHTFLGLMGAVVDAPIQAVMNMFDFDILGMNMRGFYLSLFTLCLVITIVKFVLVK